MDHTIVVVPCYNEAERLDCERFLSFARQRQSAQLLLVNDGSTDGTGEVLRQLQNDSGHRILAHSLARNSGKAEAVRQGILRALAQKPAAVGYWDADLATPLEAISQFEAVLDRHKELAIVIGSRLSLLGHRVQRNTARKYLGKAFARVASVMLGLPFHDTQCGAKLFRVTPRLQTIFGTPFVTRWLFDVEIFARLTRLVGRESIRNACYELPLDEWHEIEGSKLRHSDVSRIGRELAAIYWNYLRPGVSPEFLQPLPTLPLRPRELMGRAA
jgi:glycosyltransferase involved in cell wall biosynthesis